MSYLPVFAPQNPALNGYALGWLSCTAYSAQMAADFDTLGAKRPTGEQIRRLTGDTTGGLTLAQVDAALLEGWDVNLNTIYRLPWADFAKAIDAGKGAILQGSYAPIADSKFDAGRGFRGNHAVFVPPGWGVMDPLADGRYGQAYLYHGEAYPQTLLRAFAGQLDFGSFRLGDGLVYCSLTRDRAKTYVVTVRPIKPAIVRRYTRHQVVDGVARMDLRQVRETEGFQLACGAPKSYPTNIGTRISLVQIHKAGSRMDGWFLSSGYSKEV